MRIRQVIHVALIVCMAGVLSACLRRGRAAQLFIRFTRYGSYSSGTNDFEIARKTTAFLLISNSGPQTAVCYGGLFAWSGYPYLPTQVQQKAHWTNAAPVPAPGFPWSGLRLAGGECREVPIVLGTRLLGPPGDFPEVAVTTNQNWRVGFHTDFVGHLGQTEHRQIVWSDPVIAR